MFSQQLRHFTSFFIQLLEILSRKTTSLMKKNGLSACLPALHASRSQLTAVTFQTPPCWIPSLSSQATPFSFLKMHKHRHMFKTEKLSSPVAKAECRFPDRFRASYTGTQHSRKDYYFVGLTAANTTVQAHCILRLGKPTGNVAAHLQKLHPH